MIKDVLMGIDGGTGSVRVGLYTFSGECLAFADSEYVTVHDFPGWAEQNPEDWWNCLSVAVKNAIKKAGICPARIAALRADTTATTVVLSMKDGTPVRPSIIWMDVRARQEAEELINKTGEFYSAEWMPPKLMWLKRNEKNNYEKAEIFCEYQDWLTYKLTGKWCMNINTACNWAYNVNTGFATGLYEKCGISDALDKFPSGRVFRVGEKIGTLSKEAADFLGLCEGTPVAQGGVDSSIGILGMGVSSPGKIALITGSSNLAMALNTRPLLNPNGSNNGPDNLYRGYYTDYVGQSSTGSILKWFKDEYCKDISDKGENVYAVLDKMREEIPIGANGLIMLDYFQGNKHPYYDGNVRGMFYGLSLSHSRRDMYRAILEGVAFGTEAMLDAFREKGVKVDEINFAGGTAKSEIWLKIHADVSNVTVNVPSDTNAPCLGCAIARSVMLGIYESLQDAVKNMVKFSKTIKPNAENHEKYRKVYSLYRDIYPMINEWSKEFSRTIEQIK